MSTFTEATAHSSGETDTRFAELVTQLVRRSKRVFPALLAVAVDQVDLCRSLRVKENA